MRPVDWRKGASRRSSRSRSWSSLPGEEALGAAKAAAVKDEREAGEPCIMSAVQAANDYIADYDPEAVDEPAEEDDDAAATASDDDEEGVDYEVFANALDELAAAWLGTDAPAAVRAALLWALFEAVIGSVDDVKKGADAKPALRSFRDAGDVPCLAEMPLALAVERFRAWHDSA